MDEGHYIAKAYNIETDSWVEFNDHRLSHIPAEKVITSEGECHHTNLFPRSFIPTACILVYEKASHRAAASREAHSLCNQFIDQARQLVAEEIALHSKSRAGSKKRRVGV